MEEPTTVREVMEHRIKDAVVEFISKGRYEHHKIVHITTFASELAAEAFSVCGIPEKEQKEYEQAAEEKKVEGGVVEGSETPKSGASEAGAPKKEKSENRELKTENQEPTANSQQPKAEEKPAEKKE